MALITCEECGGQVSTKAETCPHCGAKRKNGVLYKTANAVWAVIGGVVLWVLKVALVLGGIYFVIKLQLDALWENIASFFSFGQ